MGSAGEVSMRPPEAVQGTLEAVGILPQSRESGLRRLRLRHTIVTIHKTNELQSPHLPRSQLPVPWRTRRSTGAINISCVYILAFLDPSKRYNNTFTISLCLVVTTPTHHHRPNLHNQYHGEQCHWTPVIGRNRAQCQCVVFW
jgi:hypothetical protein